MTTGRGVPEMDHTKGLRRLHFVFGSTIRKLQQIQQVFGVEVRDIRDVVGVDEREELFE